MKCTNDFILVKSTCTKFTYKVHFYNNNLTRVQTVAFTNWDRAVAFISLLRAENSIPLAYLEVIEVH